MLADWHRLVIAAKLAAPKHISVILSTLEKPLHGNVPLAAPTGNQGLYLRFLVREGMSRQDDATFQHKLGPPHESSRIEVQGLFS